MIIMVVGGGGRVAVFSRMPHVNSVDVQKQDGYSKTCNARSTLNILLDAQLKSADGLCGH